MTHASRKDIFHPQQPWILPKADDCVFYHSIDLPTGSFNGAWDIRHRFNDYIGNTPLSGKSVLDVGTASGYLAFSAEKAGATVTAVDVLDASHIRHLQWGDVQFHQDRTSWIEQYDEYLVKLKNSFWFSWHALKSNVEVVYAPIEDFPFWDRRFDVVIAGALLEHLSDPVTAIGNMALLARETLLIPFTPVDDTDDQIMRTANSWSDRRYCYTWWTLSRGLYAKILDNLGFSVKFAVSTASMTVGDQVIVVERPHIIATRRETYRDRA